MTQQEYENKIKELQDELEQLKAAKIADSGKRWKPEEKDIYWTLFDTGNCGDSKWGGDNIDKWRYLTGNCFETFEEAKEYKKQIEYTARYKNYIEEHSKPIVWNNISQRKYYALFMYEYEKNKIKIEFTNTWKIQGIIYASSEEIVWDAIHEIGEDNFKKYVLGVK